jgi:hypothetical protein
MNKIDIPYLVNYWINRCNIININDTAIEDINLLLNKNNIDSHNFCLIKGVYNNQFTFEYEEKYAFKNTQAKNRINVYNNFFKEMNNKYQFKFILNHLDFFPKLQILQNIKMVNFGFSSPNIKENHCIPIIDAHHLWDTKRYIEYNPDYKLDFNTINLENKINKIVWRGSMCPTFEKEELKLLHLRSNICEKYANNINFDLRSENMTYLEMTNFKYILNIDGYGASWDGTIWKLRSTSLVIWITDKNNEFYWLQWYHPLLKPYVHYVPSSIDNLQETFEWCEQNQEKCKEIIKNSTEIIKDILLNTIEYHKQLFDKIDEIYKNCIKL